MVAVNVWARRIGIVTGWVAGSVAVCWSLYCFAKSRPTEASAVFTGAAALAALVYVFQNHRLWQVSFLQQQEASRQNEAQLMLLLMNGYDELRDSVDNLRSWFLECSSSGPTDPIERFRDEIFWDSDNERALRLDGHRFRISRFFVRARKLSRAGFLSERILRDALGGVAIEDVFLGIVDPLDEAKAGPSYGLEDRRFYSNLLLKHPRAIKGRHSRNDRAAQRKDAR
jgi:hypothetical protein